jgi:dimeric dUTPase (all-alpha-NTP-PPase superfamily)
MTKLVFTPEQISHMLTLQDELNTLIHPNWKEQNFDWNIAALAELVEIKEWLGWKWWKKGYKQGLTEENKKQIQIEVIDILHFWLSWQLTYGLDYNNPETIAHKLNKGSTFLGNLEFAVNSLLGCCVCEDGGDWYNLGNLITKAELTSEQVYETYLSKYTLNIFRQDHGYKTGDYAKHWLYPALSLQFQEDNWFLEKAIQQIKDQGHEVSIERIRNCLEYWYSNLEGGK